MDIRKRKRGKRASREKLEMAMLSAGIKTQASLADKIAETENLASPPKDTVNRVFREQFVSPATIVRIARILQVEPASLYLDEGSLNSTEPDNTSHQNKINIPLLGKYSLVINCITPAATELAQAINLQIRKTVKTAVLMPSQLPDHYMTVDIARRYKADGVITIRSQAVDRFQAIQIFLYFEGIEQLIWTESLPTITLQQRPAQLAVEFSPFLTHALELQKNQLSGLQFAPIEAQQNYIKARVLLTDTQSETSLQRARTLLNMALQIHPGFARAHAALAEASIWESWRAETKELLEQAQESCTRALQLCAQDSYCNAVQAYLYRVSGRIPEAIELCQQILATFPDDIDAIGGLANAYTEALNPGLKGIGDAKALAQQYARKLTELEPDSWHHHLDLGNTLFITGQPLQALPAYETSVLLNPNELAYINLGVMHLCQKQLPKAHDFFLTAQKLAPESYLGHENLGMYYFFMQDYPRAIHHRKKAIDAFPDTDNIAIHQIWGILADSYRLAGDKLKAVETYAQAISMLDRDQLQGYAEEGLTVFYYYYYFHLTQLQPMQYPADELNNIAPDLTVFIEQDQTPAVYIKLTWLLYQQQNLTSASAAYNKACKICPGLSLHPDIKPITEQLERYSSLPRVKTA
jgi:tetratricopeptide (TPR) repeat protein